MVNRILGRTGIHAGVFGFGGIVVKDTPQEEANQIVREAFERGVNYFDVAPSYGDAQDKLGPALAPFRKQVTLACKTEARDAKGLTKALEASLRALRTDYFDVYQFHALTDPAEIDQVLAPRGALEAAVKARDKGQIRFIGFSSHGDAAALRLLDSYDFDSILYPVNWALMLKYNMGTEVMKIAAKRNLSRIAIKALAFGPKEGEDGYDKCWYRPIFDQNELADLALRFTLSQRMHVAISPGDVRMLRLGLDIVEKYDGNPPFITPEETERLRAYLGDVDGSIFA